MRVRYGCGREQGYTLAAALRCGGPLRVSDLDPVRVDRDRNVGGVVRRLDHCCKVDPVCPRPRRYRHGIHKDVGKARLGSVARSARVCRGDRRGRNGEVHLLVGSVQGDRNGAVRRYERSKLEVDAHLTVE